MPRVSNHYGLGVGQSALDFVDVDTSTDTALFIDPSAIRLTETVWAEECKLLLQDFFTTVLQSIKNGDVQTAEELVGALSEPNETHLGLSRTESQGKAMGKVLAKVLCDALTGSAAAATGLLHDLEDSILLLDGISFDRVSDITTNIIRGPLIWYTQGVCDWMGIPLVDDVASGPLWDPQAHAWSNEYTSLPMVDGAKLLLVPKVFVRKRLEYDADKYYRGYILESLQSKELAANTNLVRVLKSGARRVTKKDLKAKYGSGKLVNLSETKSDPRLLTRYKEDRRREPLRPHTDAEIAAVTTGDVGDCRKLLKKVVELQAGPRDATAYEKAVAELLAALFYPSLSNPSLQEELHNGRKRIDITYTNEARSGFFRWIQVNYTAPKVCIECKNYSSDPANPELDQLAGRFSPRRGRVGILVCRSFEDKDLFIQRCRDTANDDRGFIIALDDSDLASLVNTKCSSDECETYIDYPLLRERFDKLIL